MKFGICLLSIIPVRTTPSDKGEMSTQLLFGELYSILEFDLNKKWIRIKITEDEYEGWISFNQAHLISEEEYANLLHSTTYYTKYFTEFLETNGDLSFAIVTGSSFHANESNKTMRIGDTLFYLENNESLIDPFASPSNFYDLVQYALAYVNVPYLWGGKTPFGIDCSGFVQQVFRLNGYALPRDAWQQANEGKEISIGLAEPGDLAFFKNEEGKVIHVGILFGENKIIHASGFVRTDLLDEKGIYIKEENRYSHQLAFIKKIIP